MPTDATRAPASRYRLALVLAFVGGWGMSAQSRMNGEVSSVLGAPAQAAVWSFGSGLVLLGLATLLSARVRRGIGRIAAALREERLRWWQCLGGIGGGLFVAVQTAAVPLVGVAIFTVATVAGQTATGLLVDRLGIGPGGGRPILPSRVIAAVLAVVGVGVTVSGSLGDGGLSPLPVVLAVVAGAGLALQQGVNGRVNLVSRDVLATTGQNFLTGTAFLVAFLGVQWLRGAYTSRCPSPACRGGRGGAAASASSSSPWPRGPCSTWVCSSSVWPCSADRSSRPWPSTSPCPLPATRSPSSWPSEPA